MISQPHWAPQTRDRTGQFRDALLEIADRDPEMFHDAFWHCRTTRMSWSPEAFLPRLTIYHRSRDRIATQIWKSSSDLLVLTDHPDYPAPDRIFPIFSDESLHLIELLEQLPLTGKRLLDIGTGSGILALSAASRNAVAIAVDINPRSVHRASLNARLNGLQEAVRILRADVYPSVDYQFDVIVCNPPFVPLPDGYGFHVAGHGGPDGLRVVRRVLAGLNVHLSHNGILVMCCLSLIREGRPLVLDAVRDLCPRNYRCALAAIYPGFINVQDLYGCFPGLAGTLWLHRLRDEGFDSISYVHLLIHQSIQHLPSGLKSPAESRYSGTWQTRLKRYEHWNRR